MQQKKLSALFSHQEKSSSLYLIIKKKSKTGRKKYKKNYVVCWCSWRCSFFMFYIFKYYYYYRMHFYTGISVWLFVSVSLCRTEIPPWTFFFFFVKLFPFIFYSRKYFSPLFFLEIFF